MQWWDFTLRPLISAVRYPLEPRQLRQSAVRHVGEQPHQGLGTVRRAGLLRRIQHHPHRDAVHCGQATPHKLRCHSRLLRHGRIRVLLRWEPHPDPDHHRLLHHHGLRLQGLRRAAWLHQGAVPPLRHDQSRLTAHRYKHADERGHLGSQAVELALRDAVRPLGGAALVPDRLGLALARHEVAAAYGRQSAAPGLRRHLRAEGAHDHAQEF